MEIKERNIEVQPHRIHNLDYLRGLAAFGIMWYHYSTWIFGRHLADSVIGRIGVYGVSVFYVLSGLTLFHVYYDKMKPSTKDIISFFKKRVFRIYPLLWLVTILAIVLSKKTPDLVDLFLNLSGLFGFIKWNTYFSPGIWSIGNELVFYVFFPLFILFSKKYKPLFLVLIAGILFIYLFIAFNGISPNVALSKQFKNYSNPLNQVFLFLGGFLIGLLFRNYKIGNGAIIALFLLGLCSFVFIPVENDTVGLVTGINRILFTIVCFLICFCFYKFSAEIPNLLGKPLSLLGEISYSVYLIHPIVFNLLYRDMPLPAYIVAISLMIITMMVSWISYNYYEKFFISMAKNK